VAEKKTTKSEVKNDTGLPESQIRIFTDRINSINEHLKINKKDNSSRRGLMILVSKRRRLLKYLQKRNLNDYTSLIKALKIRK
jgi:small subunit ribosomal protein S15